MGDTTTSPDATDTTPSRDSGEERRTNLSLSVYPGTVTAETNQPIKFRGQVRSSRGDTLATSIQWRASGGRMSPNGTFTSSVAGTYKVIGSGRGWRKADTSVVVVVPPAQGVVRLEVSPETTTLGAGGTHTFSVVAYKRNGSAATTGVTWSATGGEIDAGGRYTAGSSAGTYRVVAANTAGTLADTAVVTVDASVPAPEPPPPAPQPTPDPEEPPPPPAPTLARVYLTPASVSLTAGASQQFAAYGRNSVGDSVPLIATFAATGGTLTTTASTGSYKAGSTAGTFRIIAASNGLADTSAITVVVPPPPSGAGVPFGVFNVTPASLLTPLDLSVFSGNPAYLMGHLAAARQNGTRVIVNFAGGKYSNNFGPDGTFSYDVWKLRVDQFRSLDLAPYIADGTIIANYLIDEPHHAASWGGKVVPQATIEQMAKYSKSIWPALKTITRTRVSWLAQAPFTWVYLDAGWAQYSTYKGDVYTYRDSEIAAARASGLGLLFGLNTTNGGQVISGCYPGSRAGQCAMTAAELKKYGTLLASVPSACGLTLWQHDATYLTRSEIRGALDEVAAVTRAHPVKACS
jgi:hypothetical protein